MTKKTSKKKKAEKRRKEAPVLILPSEFPPGLTFPLPLWRKWSREALIREFRKGRWSFNRGYRQQAPAEEDRLFGDLTKFLRYGVRVADLLPPDAPRFGGYDPAGERRIGNALVSTAVVPATGLRVIVEMDLWRGSYGASNQRVLSGWRRHVYSLLAVENVALQGAILQALQDKAPSIPLLGFMTGANKVHPELGIPGLEAEIGAGTWALCMDDPYDTEVPLAQHDPGCECAYHVFLQDLELYPTPGRAYDWLMAWWFCREAIRGTLLRVEDDGTPDEDMSRGLPEDEVAGVFLR